MLILSFATTFAVAQEKTETSVKENIWSRLSLGGYGEAVYTRNFYSDKYLRYTDAATYKDVSTFLTSSFG